MDVALLSTRVFTGDPAAPYAEAVGIRDGCIAAVGTDDDIRNQTTADTTILHLPGCLATPGFVDAHVHFMWLGEQLTNVNLHGYESLSETLAAIGDFTGRRPEKEWVLGWGWNHYQWTEARQPQREDLDAVIPDRPAALFRSDGHSIWLNTPGLARCGIDEHTTDPPGGRIERDPATGKPTGLLRDADQLVLPNIPPPREDDRRESIWAAHAEGRRCRVTGVHSSYFLSEWETVKALDDAGKLAVRFYFQVFEEDFSPEVVAAQKEQEGERRKFTKLKLFADGSLGSQTALLHDPYENDSSNFGLERLSAEQLREYIVRAYDAGLDVAVHAIGDRALDGTLWALEAARALRPGRRRDSIEHAQLCPPALHNRMAALGVTASVQPCHIIPDAAVADRVWGKSRSRWTYAFRSLLDAGIPLQLGSDAPVEPIDPRRSLFAAVARQTPEGRPEGGWFPEERLTLDECITGFTRTPAVFAGEAADRGMIRPGMKADLTVFERDLFTLPPAEWLSVKTAATIIGGKVAYRNAG